MSVASMSNYNFLEGTSSENGFHLPRIQSGQSHVSRVSSLGKMLDRYNSSDRVDQQQQERKKEFAYRFSHASGARKPSKNEDTARDPFQSHSVASFASDNVKAAFATDINKVSMPIFGSRPPTSASMISIGSFKSQQQTHRAPASLSSTKVDIEEYYNLLQDKVKINYHEIKTKFRNADPDGKGGVTKEALAHILAAVFGQSMKPLGQAQFQKLLERMEIKNRHFIRFDEFASALQVNKTESVAEFVDPFRGGSAASSHKASSSRRAAQIFAMLKERAQMKTGDIAELAGDGTKKIFKPELMNAIQGMHFFIEQPEFEKLWKKFDTENYGFVKGEQFMKRLGVANESSHENGHNDDPFNDDMSIDDSASEFGNNIPYANLNGEFHKLGSRGNSRNSSKASKNKSNNPLEKWLKSRFRDGFEKIKESFEECDRQQTGQVRRDQFLNVLNQHGFKLESNLLDAFLERCNIKIPGSQYNNTLLVSYTDFLEKFQNRSDQGLAYRMITHSDMADNKSTSTLGLVEGKLLKLFQNDFLALLQVFRKIDRNRTNSLNKQEFRAAIESYFAIELTDAEFEEFYSDLPRDNLNKVKYLEFMTRFDTDSSSTLFDSKTVTSEDYHPKRSKRREYEPIMEEPEESDNKKGRSLETLMEIVKSTVRNQYKQVEAAWNAIDVTNSNDMNKDMMFKLFKKIPITPTITREEVNTLWHNFVLKENKRLAYLQFIRHFGYSKKSACFSNSKKSPPKKGDNDMMLTSNKLGRDSILIRGSVQSKLILLFDVLKRSFQDCDPYFTNYLLKEEFEEILQEICPELNRDEMDYIYSKHGREKNGKINYTEFLSPYSPLKSKERHDDLLIKLGEDGQRSSRIDVSDPIIKKVKENLADRYKSVRMLFKQHDPKQSGYISAADFKATLTKSNCRLATDEMFTLLRILDKDITGMINYNRFINEIIKP